MQGAYKMCMERMEHEAKYDSWEKLLVKDSDSFLQVVIQKYVQNRIPEEKVEEVFRTLGNIRIHWRGRCDVHDRIRRHDLRLQRTTDDVAQG